MTCPQIRSLRFGFGNKFETFCVNYYIHFFAITQFFYWFWFREVKHLVLGYTEVEVFIIFTAQKYDGYVKFYCFSGDGIIKGQNSVSVILCDLWSYESCRIFRWKLVFYDMNLQNEPLILSIVRSITLV